MAISLTNLQGSTLTSPQRLRDRGKRSNIAFSRSLEITEQNVVAAFELAQKLVRARDIQEAMQLQSEYVRTQFAAMQTQAKELVSTIHPNKA